MTYFDQLENAYEQARNMHISPDAEIGGIILLRGLVPIPNHAPCGYYRPHPELVDLLLQHEAQNAPFLGVWHTHCRDTPPSPSDLEMAQVTWAVMGVCELVITPLRIFLVSGESGVLRVDTRF